MVEVLHAYEEYSISEAIKSRSSFRKIYENKVKDKLFRQLNELVEPGKDYKLSYSICGIEPLKGQDQDKMKLKGTMMVEITDKNIKEAN